MPDQSTPLVSVIVPVFNGEKFLAQTIESVLNQTFTNFEIVVVDDGSTDRTAQITNEFTRKDGRIKLLKQNNLGVSAARNHGYNNSTGKFLAFLDADDVWLPDNLELKLAKLKSGDYGLVHSGALVIDELGGQMSGKTIQGKEGNLLNGLLAWRETQVPGPSSILLKREVMERVGLFDDRLSTSADQDFFIRVAAHSSIGRIDRITWHYRVHNSNMHKNIKSMEHDVLIVFAKAKQANLFCNKKFEKDCFSNMYLILAASWAGDGRNKTRALYFILKGIRINPFLIFKLPVLIFRKWLKD
jgi:glycosyltransferase involved in cell wall biosynthesis